MVPVVVEKNGTSVISVTLSKNPDGWTRRVTPNGQSISVLNDLDWIYPIAHITSGSTLPEYSDVQTYPHGCVYLAMLLENNDLSHPAIKESTGKSVFTAGPTNRNNTNPGHIFAIWIEPDPENGG